MRDDLTHALSIYNISRIQSITLGAISLFISNLKIKQIVFENIKSFAFLCRRGGKRAYVRLV